MQSKANSDKNANLLTKHQSAWGKDSRKMIDFFVKRKSML